eukprot:842643-Pleurochrysis_carterae.AAC.1
MSASGRTRMIFVAEGERHARAKLQCARATRKSAAGVRVKQHPGHRTRWSCLAPRKWTSLACRWWSGSLALIGRASLAESGRASLAVDERALLGVGGRASLAVSRLASLALLVELRSP